MSIESYSALMKVYASCGFCWPCLRPLSEIGAAASSSMLSCSASVAHLRCVGRGRTELSRELSRLAPTIDVQGYLFLIRAAGRDKDACHAFDLLAELGNSGWSKALQSTITFSKRASV